MLNMIPKIILYYWHGGKIPKWRYDNIKILNALYPDAEIIKSVGENYDSCHGDLWRLKMCSENAYCLWVDNDIELAGPLDLTDTPALADEYGEGHISIVWSGNNPGAFLHLENGNNYNNRYLQHRVSMGVIRKISITGTHWASTTTGEKVARR